MARIEGWFATELAGRDAGFWVEGGAALTVESGVVMSGIHLQEYIGALEWFNFLFAAYGSLQCTLKQRKEIFKEGEHKRIGVSFWPKVIHKCLCVSACF
ncbi:MAG: hypothetical protein EB015_16015 [Methylocystaceae bacterium]|nr:hypothetical protein [Methylocystaceae bacterium]